MTARQAYELYLLPDLKESAPATRSEYRRALGHWEQLTPNPPIGASTKEVVRAFKERLIASGKSPYTVNKTWRHLRAVFRRVGPQHDRNPFGEDLIPRVPAMRLAPEPQKDPSLVSLRVIDAVYQACEVATWPASGVPAPDRWRALIVMFWNYGLRTQDMLRIARSSVNLKRGCFKYVAAKNIRKGGKFALPRTMPLNPVAAAHLRSILGDGRSAKIFAFPVSKGKLYEQWEAILKAAQVRPFDFRDLRETCNSRHEARSPGVGKWILGHAAKGVNERFYLNPSAQIRRAVRRFPQPESFLKILLNGDGQLKLF